MVVIGSIWFSSLKGHYGIVAINNGYEMKAYLGTANKDDKHLDEQHIIKYGAKFPIKQALELI